MSNLTTVEKRKFERLLQMSGGYVLNFSNTTLEAFVLDSTRREFYDIKYDYGSGSKANSLRAFWNAESNHIVAKLLGDLIDYGQSEGLLDNEIAIADCRRVVARLSQEGPVLDLDALSATVDERDFETVAKAVKDAIATASI
jgi:hypothetical protein